MLSADAQGYRVLIVEDEPLIAMMIEDMLVDLGHSVSASEHDSAEAMAALENAQFDVAQLDISLGLETSLCVAEHCDGRNQPVVNTAGYSADDLPAQCSNRAVLTRSFAVEDLKRAPQRLAPRDSVVLAVSKPLSN